MMKRTNIINLMNPPRVKALKPVHTMPTNVDAKIKAKVQEALDLHLVKWVANILRWLISRDIFKGNALGPTKVHLVGFSLDVWIVLKHFKLGNL
jgi:hypothetical protein